MDEKDRCKKCKGERIIDNEKVVEVPLEKGVPEDKDYCFYGDGDEIVRFLVLIILLAWNHGW